MKIGVPTELKDREYRVGMTPASVHTLATAGHDVVVERGAGLGSGFQDEEYEKAGASILPTADDVYGVSEMIIKVKEPIEPEYELMREGQILFTYLHLAPLPELTAVLQERKVSGVAYETITDSRGGLPLLTPMSEVAGRMSVLVGSTYLQRAFGGRGVLISGVPGVPPGDVVVIGGGIVGLNAINIAHGMRSRVTVLEANHDRMRFIDDLFQGAVTTLASNRFNLEAVLARADLLIGAVLIPGAAAPKLVTRDMLKLMKPGAVIVDVAVDQGGCFETTRPTTHSDPVYEVDGVVHYCVANMPGAVPRTSTLALNNATLPLAVKIANLGLEQAVKADPHLWQGVNTYAGKITCRPVAESQGRAYTDLAELL
ncbi:MAG: alanine dehydrogenase [Acidobacteriota bacterium]